MSESAAAGDGGARDASGDGTRSAPSDLTVDFLRADSGRLTALGHALRLKILRLAQEGPLSAKEAADLLEEPISKVSYHMKVLAESGFLEVSHQTPRRGAIETFYDLRVLVDVDQDAWESAGPELRRPIMLATIQGWFADILHAVEAGGMELEGTYMGSAHFEADAEGLDELRRAFLAYYAELLEIEANIARRRAADPDTSTTEVNVGFNLYRGERARGRNGPFFFDIDGPLMRLIPDD